MIAQPMRGIHTDRPSLRTDILVGALILAFTAVPSQVQAPTAEILLDALRLQPFSLDFLANVLGYIPLGIALANRRPIRALFLAGVISVFAELVQTFSVGRAPGIADVAANLAGAGVGLLLAARWRLLPERFVVTRLGTAVAAATAITYIVFGAGFTIEATLEKLSAWLDAPPWMTTNPRGTLSEGALEAHWSFDTADHGVISDVSGNRLNGTVINGPTFSSGVLGSAMVLDGQQWVDLGRPVSLRLTGSLTLSAWIKPLAFPWDDAAIISSLTAKELGYQLDLTIDQGPRTVGFKIGDASGRLMARYGKTPIVAGRWYHVAGVYDAKSRTLDVYLNGRSDNGCLIGTVTDRQQASSRHVFVGRRTGLAGFGFIGSVDEARVQSRPRSQSEIQAEFSAGGLVGDTSVEPAARDVDSGSGGRQCVDREARPPRIAGPLVSFGMVIALACAGLWRGWRFNVGALGLCLLIGSAAVFWLDGSTAFEPMWLPALCILSGGVVVVLAGRNEPSRLRR